MGPSANENGLPRAPEELLRHPCGWGQLYMFPSFPRRVQGGSPLGREGILHSTKRWLCCDAARQLEGP